MKKVEQRREHRASERLPHAFGAITIGLDGLKHTSESVLVTIASLQPAFWRTCRTIANHTRLKMFGLLIEEPNQTVSAMAQRLHKPLSLTSEYLQALEVQGLLTAHRTGRYVRYRLNLNSAPNGGHGSDLVAALRKTYQREANPVGTIFRLATAFTHPRRLEIVRALHSGARTVDQIQVVTRISGWALLRHLGKLEERGFVISRRGLYTLVDRPDGLGRQLARLASE